MVIRKKTTKTKVASKKIKAKPKAPLKKRALKKKPSPKKSTKRKISPKAAQKRKAVTLRKTKKTKEAQAKSALANHLAMWKAYYELQHKAEKAWAKLKSDTRRNARSKVIIEDQNHLLLLLGECNYMARECMRIAESGQ